MQKQITINGKKYNGKQIADLMDKSGVTDESGAIKFVTFGNVTFRGIGTYPLEYACEYRHDDHDGYFAPMVGNRSDANCLRITCRTYDDGSHWIAL